MLFSERELATAAENALLTAWLRALLGISSGYAVARDTPKSLQLCATLDAVFDGCVTETLALRQEMRTREDPEMDTYSEGLPLNVMCRLMRNPSGWSGARDSYWCHQWHIYAAQTANAVDRTTQSVVPGSGNLKSALAFLGKLRTVTASLGVVRAESPSSDSRHSRRPSPDTEDALVTQYVRDIRSALESCVAAAAPKEDSGSMVDEAMLLHSMAEEARSILERDCDERAGGGPFAEKRGTGGAAGGVPPDDTTTGVSLSDLRGIRKALHGDRRRGRRRRMRPTAFETAV